jgi:hypothetical protein
MFFCETHYKINCGWTGPEECRWEAEILTAFTVDFCAKLKIKILGYTRRLLNETPTPNHTHIHTRTHTYMHTYIHTYIYIHKYIHIRTHMYIHTHIDTAIHTYVHIHTYIHTYTHIYTYTHTNIHIYAHIHICIHTHAYTHRHTYIYTHTYIHMFILLCFIESSFCLKCFPLVCTNMSQCICVGWARCYKTTHLGLGEVLRFQI